MPQYEVPLPLGAKITFILKRLLFFFFQSRELKVAAFSPLIIMKERLHFVLTKMICQAHFSTHVFLKWNILFEGIRVSFGETISTLLCNH